MTNLTEIVTYLLSAGTVLADIFLLYAAILIVTKEELPLFLKTFLQNYWLYIIFLIALGSTAASLFYSSIAQFEPCVLCWYQRIFMFPLVLLFGVGLFRKEGIIKPYAAAMCIVGSLIAIYHYLLQMGITTVAPCSAIGTTSCLQMPFISFNFITIPVMSLTSFLLILVVLKLGDRKDN